MSTHIKKLVMQGFKSFARKTEIPLVSVEDKLFKIRWAGIIQYTLPIYEQHNDYQFDRVIRALCVEVLKLQS